MITVYSCMHVDIERIPVAAHKEANTQTFYTFKIALKMLCILGGRSASPMNLRLERWQGKEPFADGGCEPEGGELT